MYVNGRAYPWAYSACGDTHITQYAPRHVRLIAVSGVQEGANVGAIWNGEETLRFEDAIHAYPREHARGGVVRPSPCRPWPHPETAWRTPCRSPSARSGETRRRRCPHPPGPGVVGRHLHLRRPALLAVAHLVAEAAVGGVRLARIALEPGVAQRLLDDAGVDEPHVHAPANYRPKRARRVRCGQLRSPRTTTRSTNVERAGPVAGGHGGQRVGHLENVAALSS